MDQAPIYHSFNMSLFAANASSPGPNSTSVYAQIGLLACPSDFSVRVPMTNYAGNLGDNRAAYKPNGIFEIRAIGFQEIIDGTTDTVAMSEFIVGRAEQIDRLRSVFWPTDFSTGPPLSLNQFAARCLTLEGMEARSNIKGMLWTLGQREFTLYDHTLPINDPSCASTASSKEVAVATTATSLHPSGANCLFADGHVRFLSERINPSVWRSLGTRNGGEVISGASY
jgi:prepilin-type processing-associated H-X9-DG protein